LREERFLRFERGGMDAAAQAPHANGVLEVKHLVVEQVFDCVTGAGGAVEDAARDDGVVGRIVMAERALGVVLAPGELGTAEQAAKEAQVERVEDFVQVVEAAFGAEVALGAAGVADDLGLPSNGGRGCETLVAHALCGLDGLFIELGQQDVGDGADHRLGRALKQVRKADEDLPFAQADGGVQRGESAEADRDGRHGRARAERAVFFLENGGEVGGHG